MATKTFTMHITWRFSPENVPTFYIALRALHAKLVQEKECLSFDVYEVEHQPGVIRLVEVWDCDMKWMMEVSLHFLSSFHKMRVEKS